MTIANNWDRTGRRLFDFGIIECAGEYAGEYATEACIALALERDLDADEWCDIMTDNKGNLIAVFADCEATQEGDFYFLDVPSDYVINKKIV